MALTEPCGLDQSRPFQPSNGQSGLSPGGRFGVVRFSSVDLGIGQNRRFGKARRICNSRRCAAPRRVLPRHFTATAADGKTKLHGLMFLPPDFDERRHYPLIDWIYPGPQLSWQPRSFGLMRSAPALALAELGIITIMLDTRGMSFGSRSFHQAGILSCLNRNSPTTSRSFGNWPSGTFIDGGRVGAVGMSGGGLPRPELFLITVRFSPSGSPLRKSRRDLLWGRMVRQISRPAR